MNLINAGLILVAGLNIGMAILILLRNPRNKINIYFFLTVLFLGLWSLGIGMLREATNESAFLFWAIFENVTGFLVAVFFFFFAVYFPYEIFKLKKVVIFFASIVTILMIGVVSSHLYVEEVFIVPHNSDYITNIIGRVYYSVFFLTFTVASFYVLIKKYLVSQGEMKRTLGVILLATGFMGTLGTIFGIFVTFYTGNATDAFVPYFSIPMVLILIWFIFRKT